MLLRLGHQLHLSSTGSHVTYQTLKSGALSFLIPSTYQTRLQSMNFSISSSVIQPSLQGTQRCFNWPQNQILKHCMFKASPAALHRNTPYNVKTISHLSGSFSRVFKRDLKFTPCHAHTIGVKMLKHCLFKVSPSLSLPSNVVQK